jgi:GNAT superfamily N-acetyltransferase
MACIPVYKGKKFPSTKKLVEYLSTEEGIMAHLADGKDAEFTKAIEDAVGIAEKTISKKAAPVAKEKAAPSQKNVKSSEEAEAPKAGSVGVGGDVEIETLNPTGSIFVNYSAEQRDKMPLGKNITTYDKTAGLSPDKKITVYRGVPKDINEIQSGDFVTTNKQLAQDYAGDGKVISKEVRADEILDDKTEPLGEEYILREQSLKEALKAEEKIVTQIQSLPITRVEGLGMGQNQAEGAYYSTEKTNRYATPKNPAKPAKIDIKNPLVVTDDIGLVKRRTAILNDNKGAFEESDFEEYEVPDGEFSIDDLNDAGIAKLASLTTKALQKEGYDSIYFPESKDQEGEIVVFNKQTNEKLQEAGGKTRQGSSAKGSKQSSEPTEKKPRKRGRSINVQAAFDVQLPNNKEAAVLQTILENPISEDILQSIFGGPDRQAKSGRKSIKGERNARISMLKKNGVKSVGKMAELAASKLAEWDGNPDASPNDFSDGLEDLVVQTILNYNSKEAIAKDLLAMANLEQQQFDEQWYNGQQNEDLVKESEGIVDALTDEEFVELLGLEDGGVKEFLDNWNEEQAELEKSPEQKEAEKIVSEAKQKVADAQKALKQANNAAGQSLNIPLGEKTPLGITVEKGNPDAQRKIKEAETALELAKSNLAKAESQLDKLRGKKTSQLEIDTKATDPFATFDTKGEDAIQQINGLGIQNPLNPKETIIDGVRVEMVPYEGKGIELQSIESTEKGLGVGTRVLKKITDISDLNDVPIVVYPTQIENTTEEQLRKWYAKNGFVEQDNGEMIYTPKQKSRDEIIKYIEDAKRDYRKQRDNKRPERLKRKQQLIDSGVSEEEAVENLTEEIKKEESDFEKSLPKVPELEPTQLEIESKKNEADFKKMRQETGAKRSDRTWGNNAMGEDMGYQINTNEDAAIFIKPQEEEIDTEDGRETAITGTAIELVYVNPNKRGTGEAKKLIQKVVDAADKTGTILHLDIAPQDKSTTKEGLQKLYEGFGFKIDKFGHGVRQPKTSPFSTFDTKGEDARKVREALKQEVGPEMFRQMQLAHKNAEKILRSFPKIFQIDCP